MHSFERLLAAIAGLGITATALAGAAFVLFRYFGDKWLSAKFTERLEAYKHAQQQEMETLRFRINGLLDRAFKLHQQEFEALPELWARLNEAWWHVNDLTSPMQRYPDLQSLSEERLVAFLDDTDFSSSEKNEIIHAEDRNEAFRKIIFWHKYNETNGYFVEFNRYLEIKSILLHADLKDRLDELQVLMGDALSERAFEERHPSPREDRWMKREALRQRGGDCRKEVERLIKARLWNAARADDSGLVR